MRARTSARDYQANRYLRVTGSRSSRPTAVSVEMQQWTVLRCRSSIAATSVLPWRARAPYDRLLRHGPASYPSLASNHQQRSYAGDLVELNAAGSQVPGVRGAAPLALTLVLDECQPLEPAQEL